MRGASIRVYGSAGGAEYLRYVCHMNGHFDCWSNLLFSIVSKLFNVEFNNPCRHWTCKGKTILRRKNISLFVGTLSRVRPRNGILALVVVLVVLVVLPLRSEFIGEL